MSNIWRLGQVGDTKFGTNVYNEMLLNPAKSYGYSFYSLWVYELLRENQRKDRTEVTEEKWISIISIYLFIFFFFVIVICIKSFTFHSYFTQPKLIYNTFESCLTISFIISIREKFWETIVIYDFGISQWKCRWS